MEARPLMHWDMDLFEARDCFHTTLYVGPKLSQLKNKIHREYPN
jgi:hypothetical protein